jgi:hypothetical protein
MRCRRSEYKPVFRYSRLPFCFSIAVFIACLILQTPWKHGEIS